MASVPSSPVVAESGWPSGPRTGLPSWPYSVNVAPASGLPVTESTLVRVIEPTFSASEMATEASRPPATLERVTARSAARA